MEVPDWLLDFLDWLSAVLKHWIPLVTGGAMTAALVVINVLESKPPTWLTWIWLYAAIFAASFLAWREGARGRPKFSVHLKRVGFFTGAGPANSTWIVGRVYISNHGTPGTIHEVEIWARVCGAPTKAKFSYIGDQFQLTNPADADDVASIWPEDGLEKARGVLFEKGRGRDYVFFAYFLDRTVHEIDLSTVEVHFQDSFDGKWETIGKPSRIEPNPRALTRRGAPN